MEKIIEIKKLSKSFKEIKAVDDLTFSVRKGELFAFLGLNGAGKSTTINIMCGMLSKDKGEIIINNHNIDTQLVDVKKDLVEFFSNDCF